MKNYNLCKLCASHSIQSQRKPQAYGIIKENVLIDKCYAPSARWLELYLLVEIRTASRTPKYLY
jgi:hypothetical protein